MSDKFSIISIEQLFQRILDEEKKGRILGIYKNQFFKPSANDPFKMKRYGKILETPIGVAAGPHTQMAQNIIAAWLTGARYIELKTIQTLDQLEISKPCIDMEDEGYNCEWSQELLLKESFDEYLNAWIIVHTLRHKFGQISDTDEANPGLIFNMSVGYNMEGILKDNVQLFLDKMKNCQKEKEEKIQQLAKLYPQIKDIEIPNQLSDNITLSTMHGCPPEEIEKIARYLVEEKKYNTAIKLNPTLLGPDKLRGILNDKLGFETNVPDEAFGHDLKYPDAKNIITTLTESAKKTGVDFGLKLTNTLESMNHKNVFPPNEKMMYMSGRPLHPISIALAAKIREDFNDIDISFSAGADCFNLPEIIACNLKPVTVCSDILKPGGYTRLAQYLEILADSMKKLKAKSIPGFITAKSGNKTGINDAALDNLKNYSDKLLSLNYYKKGNTSSPEKVADSSHSTGEKSSIKTARPLEHFDCIQAPCITTCPTNQDIPQYMYHTMKGEFHKAFEAILKKNPFPAVTGMVCDHLCMTKCTRINYDNPLQIRAIKRFVSENHAEEPQLKHATPTGAKVAIIGAGPSGLSCAYFLAQAGVEVSVYETKSIPGGMVADAIPAFRLRDADIKKDIQRIEKLGVQIHYNTKVDAPLFRKLQKENDFVYIGIGAQENYPMELKGEDAPGVIDALTFLSKVRRQQPMELGSKVAIIGGGNSAMDAARTAWRMVKGKDAEVIVLYRRTRKEMPADNEEIEAVLQEGIKIIELAAPAEIEGDNGRLKVLCWKMELGEKDDSGRRRPVKIEGADFHLYFDTLIPAIGQVTQLDFLEKQNLRPVKVSGETAIQHVYMGGDALRGPLNIITAIADGKKSAAEILNAAILTGRVSLRPSALKELMHEMTVPAADIGSEDFAIEDYQMKAARRGYGELPVESTPGNRRNFHMVIEPLTEESARKEASRCLLCSDICNVCVSVCPNRANYSYEVEPKVYRLEKAYRHDWKMEYAVDMVFDLKQKFQVYNIADFCNECGNCQTFCPTAGAPYKDKPRVCLTETSFNNEDNAFFMETKDGKPTIHSKHEGKKESLQLDKDKYLYESEEVSAVFNKASFKIEKAEFKNHTLKEANFRRALEMRLLLCQ